MPSSVVTMRMSPIGRGVEAEAGRGFGGHATILAPGAARHRRDGRESVRATAAEPRLGRKRLITRRVSNTAKLGSAARALATTALSVARVWRAEGSAVVGEDDADARIRGDPGRSRARGARRDGEPHRRAGARPPAARRPPNSAGASTLLHFSDAADASHRDHQGAPRQPSAVHHRALDAPVEPLPRRGRAAQRAPRGRADHREEPRAAHRRAASSRCISRSGSPRGGSAGSRARAPVLLRPLGDPPPSRATSSSSCTATFVGQPRARPRAAHALRHRARRRRARRARPRRRRVQAAAGHRPPARADRRRSTRSPSSRAWWCRASPTSASRWRGMPPTSTIPMLNALAGHPDDREALTARARRAGRRRARTSARRPPTRCCSTRMPSRRACSPGSPPGSRSPCTRCPAPAARRPSSTPSARSSATASACSS